MQSKKRKGLTFKSWLPKRIPMELQYELAETAKKLVGISASQHITVEFRDGHGNPLGRANGTWCKTHMQGPHSLETLIHELCHIKDYLTGKPFKGYNKRWANRVHEKRAVRDTERIMKGELSERREGYRARCVELMAQISEMLKDKPERKVPTVNVERIDMRFSGEAAGDFACLIVDLGREREEDDPKGYGDWIEKHWSWRENRFRCEVQGNEEYLSELAGELSYWSYQQPSFERRSDRICEVLKKVKEEV